MYRVIVKKNDFQEFKVWRENTFTYISIIAVGVENILYLLKTLLHIYRSLPKKTYISISTVKVFSVHPRLQEANISLKLSLFHAWITNIC